MNRHEILYAHRRLRVAGKALTRFPLATTASSHLFSISMPLRSDSSSPNPLVLPKHRPLPVGLYSLSGALLGALAGWWLAYQTGQAYPLSTGGLPINDWPAQLIVSLPCALSGAFLFTCLGTAPHHFSFHSTITAIHHLFSTSELSASCASGIAVVDSNGQKRDGRQAGENTRRD
jgi:hypothetical protein